MQDWIWTRNPMGFYCHAPIGREEEREGGRKTREPCSLSFEQNNTKALERSASEPMPQKYNKINSPARLTAPNSFHFSELNFACQHLFMSSEGD